MNAELDALAYNGDPIVAWCPNHEEPGCDNPGTRVSLVDDWQAQVEAGYPIPIVGCGNPWHYVVDLSAVRPADDRLQVVDIEALGHALFEADKAAAGEGHADMLWDNLTRAKGFYFARARTLCGLPPAPGDAAIMALYDRVIVMVEAQQPEVAEVATRILTGRPLVDDSDGSAD